MFFGLKSSNPIYMFKKPKVVTLATSSEHVDYPIGSPWVVRGAGRVSREGNILYGSLSAIPDGIPALPPFVRVPGSISSEVSCYRILCIHTDRERGWQRQRWRKKKCRIGSPLPRSIADATDATDGWTDSRSQRNRGRAQRGRYSAQFLGREL